MRFTGLFRPFGFALACAAGTMLSAADDIQFNRDIRPILSDNCFACHGPSSPSRQADLRLDQRDSAMELGVLSPGDAANSELLRRVVSTDPDEQMPPPESKKTLTAQQQDLLRRWIESGAEYQPHWAFLAVPKTIAVPQPEDGARWIRNPIDAFVLDRLRKENLETAEAAAKETWLRRVSFDLAGLPPTLDELDAFLTDDSPEAYETVVNRLLGSPAYAERMANDWLDAARYADTFGYQADRDMHMWPWRDWVIRAFQSNLPYRDFILWQIAGDMLENPTFDQRLATAFNRLHRQTNEGGSIEEEFRIEYVADRVRTVGSAFLGLTFECARCHDHKYDPITQREYYSLTAFFNNIDEHGLYSHFTETAPTPVLRLYEGDQEAKHHDLLSKIAAKQGELDRTRQDAKQRFVVQVSNADEAAESSASTADAAVDSPEPVSRFSFDDLTAAGDYSPVEGHAGKAIAFGGDDAFVCANAGVFTRVMPFSLSLWLKPSEHQPRQVVVHRSRAAEDSAFRGYALTLDNGEPVFSLVHFWPGNAIRVRSKKILPLNAWTHVTVTYDGSSHAEGVRLYVNGENQPLEVERDRLTRDIIHRAEWGDYDAGAVQLSLGARFRDVGFRNGAVDDFLVFDRVLTSAEAALVAGVEVPTDVESRFEQAWTQNPDRQKLAAELQELRTAENELIGQVREIMAMEERPDRRPTYLLARGAYDAPTDPVEPTTPAGIFPMPDELPRNRLGFAKWMVDERNPLTARVAVNRFWTLFFGRGLVATSQDFGSQGSPPTHPELLDWLARDFMDHGWDVQRLCRMIVLSATYRQSSTPRDPATFESDPDNRLLARGPRHRLSAEQLRDDALAVSGLLKPRIGGPSVFPYQPPGLWEEAGTGKSYSPSTGDDLYRRSLYSFWRRTSPPPTMTAFDAPTREYCVVQRERTGTPLQALTLLNDPQFIEASRVLAGKELTKEGNDASRLTEAFRKLTSRVPNEDELSVLQKMLDRQRAYFSDRKDEATKYVSTGAALRNESLDITEHASLTAVIQALMNFDECVTKR